MKSKQVILTQVTFINYKKENVPNHIRKVHFPRILISISSNIGFIFLWTSIKA